MESESWEAEGHKSTGAERTWYRKWETVTSPSPPPPNPPLYLHGTTKGRSKNGET